MSGKEIEFEIISDGAGRQKVLYETDVYPTTECFTTS